MVRQAKYENRSTKYETISKSKLPKFIIIPLRLEKEPPAEKQVSTYRG